MNKLQSTFKSRHVFLPVVHAENLIQAMRNVGIAKDNGAHGVFLINHSILHDKLIWIYEGIKLKYPNFWIGMNLLDVDPLKAFSLTKAYATGLWVDNAGIDEAGASTFTMEFQDHRKNWDGIYFGGVAFKYQQEVLDPAKATLFALPYVDVITTSGDATGLAADPVKIKRMKDAIGDHPLAIASGITPENVRQYMDHVDCFLVATGISDSYTGLSAARVRELADILSS